MHLEQNSMNGVQRNDCCHAYGTAADAAAGLVLGTMMKLTTAGD